MKDNITLREGGSNASLLNCGWIFAVFIIFQTKMLCLPCPAPEMGLPQGQGEAEIRNNLVCRRPVLGPASAYPGLTQPLLAGDTNVHLQSENIGPVLQFGN